MSSCFWLVQLYTWRQCQAYLMDYLGDWARSALGGFGIGIRGNEKQSRMTAAESALPVYSFSSLQIGSCQLPQKYRSN